MAVEGRRLDLFSPQLLTNRDLMNPFETNNGLYNPQTGYGVISATSEAVPLPMYGANGNVPVDPLTSQVFKSTMVSVDSACSNYNGNCNLPLQSRKRSRDSVNSAVMADYGYTAIQPPKSCAPFSVLGQDISSQILQQQLDIDRLIAIHMERVKLQIEENRKRHLRTIMEAMEQGVMKKLRAKEVERENMGRLNHALVERVKSLCVENKIWRDLAQTNEATANALRTNLEQLLLAQIRDTQTAASGAGGIGFNQQADDAQSACGSSSGDDNGREITSATCIAREARGEGANRMMCRKCGEEESCVLLLPCRHLCLCATCGSHVYTCPVCKSPKNASVHVNMST